MLLINTISYGILAVLVQSMSMCWSDSVVLRWCTCRWKLATAIKWTVQGDGRWFFVQCSKSQIHEVSKKNCCTLLYFCCNRVTMTGDEKYLDWRGVHCGKSAGWRGVRREADPTLLAGEGRRVRRPHSFTWYLTWGEATNLTFITGIIWPSLERWIEGL